MARLIIKREAFFLSKVRDFKVILDGKEIGKVANGATGEFEVTPGQHTLQTGISKLEGISPVVTINVDESADCVMTTKPNPLMLVALVIAIFCGVNIGRSLSAGISVFMLVMVAVLIAGVIFAFKKGVILKPA